MLDYIENLLQTHGLRTDRQEEWIWVEDESPALTAVVANERHTDSQHLVQVDFKVALDDGRTIIESLVGRGTSKDHAMRDVVGYFVHNVFHVLLAAFWPEDTHSHADVEEWTIGGEPWRVCLGNFTYRSAEPTQDAIPAATFGTLDQLIKECKFEHDVNWVRMFYGNQDEQIHSTEVMLNNEVWKPAQEAVAALDWPKRSHYYSTRIFFILQRLVD